MSTRPSEQPPAEPWHVVEVNPNAPQPWAFTDLAASLHAALRRQGWAGGLHVELPPDDGVCCVVGWTPQWLARHAARLHPQRVVLFNVTPVARAMGEQAGTEQAAWLAEFGHWVVADLHQDNIERLKALDNVHWHGGTSGARLRAAFLPLPPVLPPGPAATAATSAAAQPIEPDIDVLLVGTPSDRREALLQALGGAGLRVGHLTGAYGAELTPWLRRARLLVHAHHGTHHGTDHLLPWARLLQPLALGLPVVCEDSVGHAAELWRTSGVVFAPLDELPQACLDLLASAPMRAHAVEAGQRFAAGLDSGSALIELRALLGAMPEQHPLDTLIDRELGVDTATLPPPAGQTTPPVPLVQRTPGPNLSGRVVVVIHVLITLLLLWWFAVRR